MAPAYSSSTTAVRKPVSPSRCTRARRGSASPSGPGEHVGLRRLDQLDQRVPRPVVGFARRAQDLGDPQHFAAVKPSSGWAGANAGASAKTARAAPRRVAVMDASDCGLHSTEPSSIVTACCVCSGLIRRRRRSEIPRDPMSCGRRLSSVREERPPQFDGRHETHRLSVDGVQGARREVPGARERSGSAARRRERFAPAWRGCLLSRDREAEPVKDAQHVAGREPPQARHHVPRGAAS